MILDQLPEVQRLSTEEKRQLAEELWLSVAEADEIEVDPAIAALLEQRLAEYEADPGAVSPWAEVKARILSRHGE